MRAHNTLIRKRINLDLQPGEHARLLAVNRAGRWEFSVLVLLGAGPVYLTFDRVDTTGWANVSPQLARINSAI